MTTASGAGFPGATVAFAVTAGGGSLSGTSATTDAQGQASVTWTLGRVAGINNNTATASTSGLAGSPVTFVANAVAGPAATMAAVSGDNQVGLVNAALAAPIVVRVTDQFSNNVSGTTVAFVVTSGGGSVNPTQAATGANGQAQTIWTLGGTVGTQTMQASASSPSGSPLTGSPVGFSATGSTLVLTAVAPDTLVEGQSATLTGGGFSTTPANNLVTVGGLTATVTSATSTSLVITVPQSNCQPARDAGITVTVSSVTSNSVTKRVNPALFLNLAVGQQVIIEDPTQFCLQFRASTTGGDAYLIGVGASAESPSSTLPFNMAAVSGAATPVAPFGAVRPIPVRRSVGATVRPSADGVARAVAQLGAEVMLREWERRNLRAAPAAQRTAPIGRAGQAVPNVGDTVQFKVPSDFSNPCNVFVTVKTVVRKVGAAGIWVTDITNPAADSLTSAQISAYSDTFDTKIFATDTSYFGPPSDLDANQRIFVVLTVQVNKITNPPGVAGFVFGGDLVSPASCAQSNQGEIFYGQVPDSLNAAGTGARPKSSVLLQMPSLIAHEFSHVIQNSRRIVLASGIQLSSWEAEGQAVLAEEVVGHDVLGNSPGNNYGVSVVIAGDRWYGFAAAGAFADLPMYFGWLPPGSTSKAVGAPELCTLFGSTAITTACNPFAFYGASWSFQRYIADRYGPGYPGGEKQLNRDLIGKNVSLRGVSNIQALLPTVNFDTLFDRWATVLYLDDRVAGLPAELTLPSWNLFNIANAYVSDAFRLIPTNRTFSAFTDSRSMRGGSTAYTLLSAAGARPALGLRVRDQTDAVLGTGMKPQLWIVRLQ